MTALAEALIWEASYQLFLQRGRWHDSAEERRIWLFGPFASEPLDVDVRRRQAERWLRIDARARSRGAAPFPLSSGPC